LFRFFLCNLSFLFYDQHCELGFALVAGFGIDVEFFTFAVWQARIEAAFLEAIAHLIDATRIGFADLIGYRKIVNQTQTFVEMLTIICLLTIINEFVILYLQ